MFINDGVIEEERGSSQLYLVIWILTGPLLQRTQAEFLPEQMTTEEQMDLPGHLRSCAGTNCWNPGSELFILIFKSSPKMNSLLYEGFPGLPGPSASPPLLPGTWSYISPWSPEWQTWAPNTTYIHSGTMMATVPSLLEL